MVEATSGVRFLFFSSFSEVTGGDTKVYVCSNDGTYDHNHIVSSTVLCLWYSYSFSDSCKKYYNINRYSNYSLAIATRLINNTEKLPLDYTEAWH